MDGASYWDSVTASGDLTKATTSYLNEDNEEGRNCLVTKAEPFDIGGSEGQVPFFCQFAEDAK